VPSSTFHLPALQGELWQQERAISSPGTLQNVSIPSILGHLTIVSFLRLFQSIQSFLNFVNIVSFVNVVNSVN
jgi:hypothetical protein